MEKVLERPPSIAKLTKWRMSMKEKLAIERGWVCERCQEAPFVDLDEGIVTRGDMRGFTNQQKLIAFSECNLFLLCMKCNREEAHQRQWAFEKSCQRYGEETVREWYRSLNLKAPCKGWL